MDHEDIGRLSFTCPVLEVASPLSGEASPRPCATQGVGQAGASPRCSGVSHGCLFAYEVALILVVLISVTAEVLNSVPNIRNEHHKACSVTDALCISLLALDFCLRCCAESQPRCYPCSCAGAVDLLSFLPGLLEWGVALLFPEAFGFYAETELYAVPRMLRACRIFRFLKLVRYVETSKDTLATLRGRSKIADFVFALLAGSLALSTGMYVIEGSSENFDSIPCCFYWVVVTISTVGYGDMVPGSTLGKAYAIVVIALGYSAIVAQGFLFAEPPPSSRAAPKSHCDVLALEAGTASVGALETLKSECGCLSASQRAELMVHLSMMMAQDLNSRAQVCSDIPKVS